MSSSARQPTASSLTAWRSTLALVLAGIAALPGCTKRDLAKPAAPLTPPARLCAAQGTASSCRTAHEIERLLAAEDLQILGMDDPPGGLQGAKILTLRGSAGGRSVTFRVRWRAQSTADVINEPRKELAAYAVQKLFLNDEELVAPPTAAYCFSLAAYRRFAPDEKATFRGVDCVLGFATYWLEGVKTVSSAREDGWVGNHSDSTLWDPGLFERDPMYRASISKCNLLTHLINHGDAHGGQLLLEQTPRGLRAYVVDNSVAFLSIKNPVMLFREDWARPRPTRRGARARGPRWPPAPTKASQHHYSQRRRRNSLERHPPTNRPDRLRNRPGLIENPRPPGPPRPHKADRPSHPQIVHLLRALARVASGGTTGCRFRSVRAGARNARPGRCGPGEAAHGCSSKAVAAVFEIGPRFALRIVGRTTRLGEDES
jgi:hypothetical protein